MKISHFIFVFAFPLLGCRPVSNRSYLATDDSVVKAEEMTNSQYSGELIPNGFETNGNPTSFSVRQYDSTGEPLTTGGNNKYGPPDSSIKPDLLLEAWNQQKALRPSFGITPNGSGDYFLPENKDAGVPPEHIRQNGQWLQRTDGKEDLSYFAGDRNQNKIPINNPLGFRYVPVKNGADDTFLNDNTIKGLNGYYEQEALTQMSDASAHDGPSRSRFNSLSQLRDLLRGSGSSK